MINAFSVNNIPVKPVNDNQFDAESKLAQNGKVTDANIIDTSFEETVASQLITDTLSTKNTELEQAEGNQSTINDEAAFEQLIDINSTNNPNLAILQQAQMLAIANESSLTNDTETELSLASLNLNSNLTGLSSIQRNQESAVDVEMKTSATRLPPHPLEQMDVKVNASLQNFNVNSIPQRFHPALTTNSFGSALSTDLTSNQEQPITMVTVKQLFDQVTQSSSPLTIQQAAQFPQKVFAPATQQIDNKQDRRLAYNQFIHAQSPSIQSLASTHLVNDFSFVEDTKTDFVSATRFSPYNVSEHTNIANWQMQPVMTEVKDVPMMQLTTSALDKPTNENSNVRAMTYGTNSLEQQRTQQLQQLITTGNYTEVTVKDSKLGDIRFSVSGKEKEHLGVFVAQSQTQNVIQVNLQQIQQELAEEGVTDFEMFSSKEEQEQQKQEYFARQSKSFAQNQQELLEQELPVPRVSIISNYRYSSINIMA